MEGKIRNNNSAGNSAGVLIPVDFSPAAMLSVEVGFELARRLSEGVTLIHASVVPEPAALPQFPDDFNGMDNTENEIEQMELDREVRVIDDRSMDGLRKKIAALQQQGALPQIPFDTVVAPGMPEEVIRELCVAKPPKVVVMATRSNERRREELIGSVTAEVIDQSFAPVLTVPQDYTFHGFKEIVRICAFCHFDGGDFEAVSRLLNMFNCPEVSICLFPVSDRYAGIERTHRLRQLQGSLKEAFPNSEFTIADVDSESNLRTRAEELFEKERIQMILAPNRRRNALSRFFHPGLAHKILYEIDFPMLAIPV